MFEVLENQKKQGISVDQFFFFFLNGFGSLWFLVIYMDPVVLFQVDNKTDESMSLFSSFVHCFEHLREKRENSPNFLKVMFI